MGSLRAVVAWVVACSVACLVGGSLGCKGSSPAHPPTTPGPSREAVGFIDHRFEVNHNGAATYRIKLKTPPGIQSLQPQLEIAYSSQGDNGVLGKGFALNGLSAIHRCKAILAIDKFAGGIGYDANDRFCLDGQRLVNIVPGDYQAPNAIYHTEREQWSKIVPSYQGCSQGPCSFTVTTKQGTVMQYGTTLSSRIFAQGGNAVREWALAQVQDLHGNQLTIEYQSNPTDVGTGRVIESPGAYYAKTISYTQNSQAGFAPNRFVDFGWEARPDPSLKYLGGYVIQTAARLARITTRIASAVVTDYRFVYEASGAPGTGRSRLARVRECNGTGVDATCLSDTSVGPWQDQGAAFMARSPIAAGAFTANQGWGNESRYPRTAADVNGDGRMDLVGFGDANAGPGFRGVQVALSTGMSCGPASSWTQQFGVDANTWIDQSSTPRYVADVNADGLADLLGFGSDGVRVGLSTKTAFDTQGWNQGRPYTPFNLAAWDPKLYPRTIADIDGDQLVDLVGFKNGVQVALSTQGTGFAPLASWFSGDFSYEFGWTELTPRVTADVNGDGRDDIVGFGVDGVKVALSTGTSFVTSGWTQTYAYFGYNQGWDPQLHPRMVSDVNGDGLADLIGLRNGVQVGLSTGKGFLPPRAWSCGFSFESATCTDPVAGQRTWTPNMARQMTDVNGDGFADIVGFNALGDGSGKVVVGLSTGTAQGGFQTSTWNQSSLTRLNPNSNPVMLADINGDGLTDALNFADDGVYAGFVAGPIPDLLTRISDGLGGSYSIQYAPLSSGAPLYQDDIQQSVDPARVSAQTHSTFRAPIGAASVPVYRMRRIGGDRMAVVAGYTSQSDPARNASAYAYTYNYRYKDAAVSLLGRGWLGFAQVSVIDASAGTTTARSYLQAFPFTSSVSQKTTVCNAGPAFDPLCKTDGANLRQLNYTFLCQDQCPPAQASTFNPFPGVYQVLRNSEIDTHFSYGARDYALGTTTHYDPFGNATLVSKLGYVAANGQDITATDNVYTHRRYLNDAGQQQYGRLTAKLVSSRNLGPAWAGADCGSAPTYSQALDFSLETRSYAGSAWDLEAECHWDATNAVWLPVHYRYDPQFGNRTAVIAGRAGFVTDTTYETTFQTYPASVTKPPNADGKRFTKYFGYDPRFGKRVAHTDFNGNVSLGCIDDFGRPSITQGPPPAQNTPRSSNCLTGATVTGTQAFATAPVVTLQQHAWSSDGAGGIYRQDQSIGDWPEAGKPAPKPIRSQSYLDGLQREYKRVTADAGNAQPAYLCTQWNSSRRKVRESLPAFASGAVDCAQTTQPATTYAYDAYGRTVRMSVPTGADGKQSSVTTYQYQGTNQGSTVTETRAAADSYAYQRVLKHAYFNGERRTVSMTLPSNNNALTTYSHDLLGRNTGHTDPGGSATVTSYDSLGRKLQTTPPVGGATLYYYDPATGWLVRRVSSHNTEEYQRDTWGRLIQKTATAAGQSRVARYTYDDPQAGNGIGRLTSTTMYGADSQPQSQTAYSYDAYGSRASTQLTVGGETYRTTKQFDPLRRQVGLTYPGDSETLVADYDGLRLQSLAIGANTYATYDTYNAFGFPEHMQLGNGVQTTYDLGPTGELQSQTVTAADNQLIFSNAFTWDHLGQVSTITDSVAKQDHTFEYQSRRLTTATSSGVSTTYKYAPNGNLTQKGDLTLTYTGQQLGTVTQSGRSVWSAKYDPAGRISSKQRGADTYTYTYDPLGKLASVTGPTGTTLFVYDALGRRVSKTDPDGTRTIYAGPEFEAVRFQNGARQVTQYIGSPTGRVAAKTVALTGAPPSSPGVPALGTFYLHHGYLESTSLTTDAQGQLVSRSVYEPYGLLVSSQGNQGFRYRYTSKEYDSTGLYYYGARYYDPFVARFISPDSGAGAHPFRQDTFNRYGYALGNPVTYNDPTGKMAGPAIAGCVFAGISAAGLAGNVYYSVTGGTTLPKAIFTGVSGLAVLGSASVCIYNISKALKSGSQVAGNGDGGNGDGGGSSSSSSSSDEGANIGSNYGTFKPSQAPSSSSVRTGVDDTQANQKLVSESSDSESDSISGSDSPAQTDAYVVRAPNEGASPEGSVLPDMASDQVGATSVAIGSDTSPGSALAGNSVPTSGAVTDALASSVAANAKITGGSAAQALTKAPLELGGSTEVSAEVSVDVTTEVVVEEVVEAALLLVL